MQNRLNAELLTSLTEQQRCRLLGEMTIEDKARLLWYWPFWSRKNQLPPSGDWFVWLLLAGRGFGKTRTAAEWVRQIAGDNAGCRIAIVAETAADARDVCIEGESGLLAISPPSFRPFYEPSKRRITWPNGSQATTYSADDPDQLRGPQHHFAWCDELAKFRYAEDVWSNLIFGLRLGANPRACVTTTPRPTKIIKQLANDPRTAITRGGTRDNSGNLPASFLSEVEMRYAGTRLGRQELDGEILNDVPGALWTREMIERSRVKEAPDNLMRVVVAIDPPATTGENADECGIVACGVDTSGRAYVLEDASSQGESPENWARRAINLYHRLKADRIVAEVNNGGAMVESVVRSVDNGVSYKAVHATRGKARRAEPIAALYEQAKVSHVGPWPKLEDQLCELTPDFNANTAGYSPDRADALVWALTDLLPLINKPRIERQPRASREYIPGWSA